MVLPPDEKRRLGWRKPGSLLWFKRYWRLKAEGFVHKEAVELATGRIGTPDVKRGRDARRRWHEGLISKGWSQSEIAEAVDEMYEEFGWSSYWAQFYPEEE